MTDGPNQHPSTAGEEVKTPALVAYLDELVDELRSHVAPALDQFEEKAVHQARVATRRLSAALELLEPVLDREGYRSFKKVLRKLRKRLGPHRDLDVLIGHVEEAAGGNAAGAFLLGALRARQAELRRKALAKSQVPKVLAGLTAWQESLRPAALSHAEAFRPLIAEGVHQRFDEFSTIADLLAHEQGEQGGKESLGSKGAINPHELRIAGKLLRYSLELAEAEGDELPRLEPEDLSLLKTFKGLQETLGAWHDQVVLAETAIALVGEECLTYRHAELGAEVLTLAAQALEKASESLDEFAELWVARGQAMGGVVREAFALTREGVIAPSPTLSDWPASRKKRRPRRKPVVPGEDGKAAVPPPEADQPGRTEASETGGEQSNSTVVQSDGADTAGLT